MPTTPTQERYSSGTALSVGVNLSSECVNNKSSQYGNVCCFSEVGIVYEGAL